MLVTLSELNLEREFSCKGRKYFEGAIWLRDFSEILMANSSAALCPSRAFKYVFGVC